jgi:hypothetical protein
MAVVEETVGHSGGGGSVAGKLFSGLHRTV